MSVWWCRMDPGRRVCVCVCGAVVCLMLQGREVDDMRRKHSFLCFPRHYRVRKRQKGVMNKLCRWVTITQSCADCVPLTKSEWMCHLRQKSRKYLVYV